MFSFYLKNAKRVNNWDLVDASASQIVGEYLVNDERETKTPPSVPPLIGEGKRIPLPPIRGETERGVQSRLALLTTLARSPNLWERRIAIVATFAFIRANRFKETIHLATLLLNDKHDLIHKATGWMLREVGKREMLAYGNTPLLKKFLNQHHPTMPRTMLRYAIEKLNKKERRHYINARPL
ncbi:MAG: DNA alkylation repair protein [Candidatus Magasanikbacteria bacterium]|nr:DNA alkylation repair protein [Candidatus Magasanikbacteria bacterium]